ncbi:MAG TPA: nucleoside deaminase [Candidatus Limnocylindria bacterium]|nr:nucleoside deaminase [Candidatus Limnocylindria bacterium]
MQLSDLQPPWPTVFELMWDAYIAGTIPVGAVVADDAGTIVSRGRNRIFTPPADGQLGGTRLGHAEINALVALSSERTYPELTLYTALEPCHLCLAAATSTRVGAVRYAAADPYGGAVGKLLASEDMRQHPVRIEGPLHGPAGLIPEVLLLRHMLWRVPDGPGMVPLYRRLHPELVDIALRIPAPRDATTLSDAFARIGAAP